MNEEAIILQIGNTTCKLIRMSGLHPIGEAIFSHADVGDRIVEAYHNLCGSDQIPLVLCSVVPSLAESVLAILRPRIVFTVDPERVDWFRIDYHPRSSLGADRLCNAIALREEYGFPSLAVDCGTAITVNVLDEKGDFIGGWIVPGLHNSASLLSERTALLPYSKPEQGSAIIGNSTETGIRSGILWTVRFGIRSLKKELERVFGCNVTIVFTGGDAHFIADDNAHKDPYLTAKGAIIYHRMLKRS